MCVDHQGLSLIAKASPIANFLDVTEGEALGLLKAIQWLTTLEYHHVVFETGCKVVGDKLGGLTANYSEFGCVLKDCHHLLRCNQGFSVVFSNRSTNRTCCSWFS